MNPDNLRLYAITKFGTTLNQIEAALAGGVTMLQLREKHLSKVELIDKGKQVKKICERYNIPLIINDFSDVAIKVGADGVHVGVDDESVKDIRKRIGKNFIIGATAKTIAQAQQAELNGADYIGVGAIFPSPTKQNAIRITKIQLKEICAAVNIPAIAIGGITLENISQLDDTGINGVAVVSAIFDSDNISEAVKLLRRKIDEVITWKI